MIDEKKLFEKIYQKPGAVWTIKEPPEALVELIESGKVKPCRVLDIGCGEGFYSIYLASKGFDVTGIDFSERAIGYARDNAVKSGVNVRFIAMDLADLGVLGEKFGFVLEWAIMHHIAPGQREAYLKDVDRLLDKGGKYFSISFNEKSPRFGGAGKVRKSGKNAPGITLHFSSQKELRELFEPCFRITDARVTEAAYKEGRPHIWNCFFMEKK